jgi:hypothetical protein
LGGGGLVLGGADMAVKMPNHTMKEKFLKKHFYTSILDKARLAFISS